MLSQATRRHSRSLVSSACVALTIPMLTLAGGAQSSLAATSAPPSTAPPSSAPVDQGDVSILLPAPTGEFATGTTLIHLRDDDRTDPLDPDGGPRELMVQLWYPTEHPAGPLAPYAPPAEAESLQQFYPVPSGAFTAATNSHAGAAVAPGEHELVFFHHGLCAARTDSTIVAEQLASEGSIVVALGSTREMPAVAFPDGRVITTADPTFCTAATDFSSENQTILETLLQVRVDDVTFTLDQLELANEGQDPDVDGALMPDGLTGSMDVSHVGIYGHSFGGSTAAAVMFDDSRFVAGVDLDGLIVGPVAEAGLDRPFLVVGSSYHTPELDPSWATFLPALRGWHRWFAVTDAGHYRFVDIGGSTTHWGLDATLKPQDPETWTQIFGDVDDARSQQIDRTLVAGFFDTFLRDEAAPVLDDPSATFSDVVDRTSIIPATR